jgi:dihydrofolate reductase
MAKLVLMMGVSLDGLVTRTGHGALGWGVPPEDPEIQQRKLDWLADVSLHLMGRKTYEEMAQAWPNSDHRYAAPMNDIPKVVFSKTLEYGDWAETRIASGDLAQEITELKSQPGKDMIAWGGATFAQSLIREGLVDEYRLTIQPVFVGDGARIADAMPEPRLLELVEAQTYPTGRAFHIYRPA